MVSMLVMLVQMTGLASAALHYPISLAAAASLLEVRVPSPRAVVRAAYRKKASVAHPDVCSHASAAEEFGRITAAYEILLQFGTSAVATAVRPSSTSTSESQQQCARSSSPGGHPGYSGTAGGARASGAAWTASQGQHRDPERMARRVEAWRKYWQLQLQASQLADEAQRQQQQHLFVDEELQRLRARLAEALALAADTETVDRLRELIDETSVRLADLQCATESFQARAGVLHREALRQSSLAQCIC